MQQGMPWKKFNGCDGAQSYLCIPTHYAVKCGIVWPAMKQFADLKVWSKWYIERGKARSYTYESPRNGTSRDILFVSILPMLALRIFPNLLARASEPSSYLSLNHRRMIHAQCRNERFRRTSSSERHFKGEDKLNQHKLENQSGSGYERAYSFQNCWYTGAIECLVSYNICWCCT